MGDSFVDVTYRGLEVGRRLRIREFSADGAYVEAPAPMPVGTSIEITIEGGIVVKATVARVHEQVGGSDRPPGMGVHAVVDTAARAWWERMRAESPAPIDAVPHPAGEGDGGNTEIMSAIDPETLELSDDGQRTAVMAIVDAEPTVQVRRPATGDGEDSGDIEIEVSNGNGDDEDVSQDGPSPTNGAGGTKKRKRRRTRSKK
jgi:hypothetical protein